MTKQSYQSLCLRYRISIVVAVACVVGVANGEEPKVPLTKIPATFGPAMENTPAVLHGKCDGLGIHGREATSKAVPPRVETIAEHDQRMAWWREARFGMFIQRRASRAVE
jgi:hypothetical protein